MSKSYFDNSLQPSGEIEFKEIKPGVYRAFFTPAEENLTRYIDDAEDYTSPIFDIDVNMNLLTVRPFQVRGFFMMSSKYKILQSITVEYKEQYAEKIPTPENVENFLARILPIAFVQDYNYGLGFKQGYRLLFQCWKILVCHRSTFP
ncbi:MAG: hypothetical protein QM802_12070 [Agriterribacter sp.]